MSENAERIREKYPAGTKIRLINMSGENIPEGITGTVQKVDDAGQIHVAWQGPGYYGSLALIEDLDEFEALK